MILTVYVVALAVAVILGSHSTVIFVAGAAICSLIYCYRMCERALVRTRQHTRR